MALSYVQKLGDGTTRNFDFTFDYLSRKHVAVTVNGVPVPFTWTSTYTILTATAPAALAVVEVRRTTPRTERLVAFTDGSTLVATDLNTSTLQSFMLAQEAFDQGAASMTVTEDGQYSAGTRRVTLLGDPVNAGDAVTKRWAETAMTSQLTLAIAARELAQTAKAATDAARDATLGYRNEAQQARTDAQAARDSANGHRLNAQNALTATETARNVAIEARDTALGYRNTAKTHLDAAEIARDQASGFRNEGLTFRNQAEQFSLASDSTTRLSKAQNLGDVPNKATALQNLGGFSKDGGPITGNVQLTKQYPVLTLKDTVSPNIEQMISYLSWHDIGGTERAWVGYGSSGDEDLSLLNAAPNGALVLATSRQTAARFSKDGDVNFPRLSYFHAYGGPLQGGLTVARFTSVGANNRACFSTETWRFTAPVNGVYYFSTMLLSDRPSNSGSSIDSAVGFYKNGAPYGNHSDVTGNPTSADGYHPVGLSAVIPMSAGDYVTVNLLSANTRIFPEYRNFCGWQIA